MVRPLLRSDLDEVLKNTEQIWPKGVKLFVTGGTGFFGKWIQETFAHANRELQLGSSLTVLTRNKAQAQAQLPHLAGAGISFIEGDVRSVANVQGEYTHVIHAATPTAQLWQSDAGSENVSVEGTKSLLRFLERRPQARLLHCSSGAVYHSMDLTDKPPTEADPIGAASADGSSVYADGKRASEKLILDSGTDFSVARCFAFLGPHLPTDGSFAAGQFLKSALEGKTIKIKGSGRDERSYMYPTDLAVWLWTILFQSTAKSVFNVGSPTPVTILELANAISAEFGLPAPVVAGEGGAFTRYYPNVDKVERELGLRCNVGLPEAVRRTKEWAQQSGR